MTYLSQGRRAVVRDHKGRLNTGSPVNKQADGFALRQHFKARF